MIQTKIFLKEETKEVVPLCSAHIAKMTICELPEWYNVAKEEYGEEDHRKVQVLETEGEQAVEGPDIESAMYTHPINMWKVNIGMTKNPNFVQIRDY